MTLAIAPYGTRVAYSYRVESLDWQRGLLALSIMIYHLMFWHGETTSASSVIGRMGIYAVSMFFVLSGLSMAIAYERYELTIRTSIQFYVRRVFRIWPLLWLAVLAVTAKSLLLKHEEISPYKILLNLTTTFGFIDPSAYLNTGAWSIGNEMVYYALTPLFLLIFRRSVAAGNALVLASIVAGAFYALSLITPALPLESQWTTYIHPLNNLFFYVIGVAIYYNGRQLKPQLILPTACIVLSIALFTVTPSGSDNSSIVIGINRLLFSSASILMVFGFFKLKPILPTMLSVPLERLGIITYGVYLLHPIVNSAVTMAFMKLNWQTGAAATIVIISFITIAAANASYQFIEKPMIQLGKKITN
jgi:peptidoglycan/LPS O-acetylase OafA/YrhL